MLSYGRNGTNGRKTVRFAKEENNLPRTTKPCKVSISRVPPRAYLHVRQRQKALLFAVTPHFCHCRLGHVTCFDSSHRSQ